MRGFGDCSEARGLIGATIAQMLPSKNESGKPKLLEQVRRAIRGKHYSLRTEEAYVDWVRRYILYHGKRHPRELGAAEAREFASSFPK